MTTLRIPAPLRTYTDGQSQVDVQGDNVGKAMESLVAQHPDLRQHLFNGRGELRPFVNLYLNKEDIRHLQQLDTPVKPDDSMMIVPSIAGGLSQVDHAAIRTNQALIIVLSVIAFILDLPWLVALVALVMALGTVLKVPGFGFLYQLVLKPLSLVKPDVLADNPEPHRFAQGFGVVVLSIGVIALVFEASILGWGLVWLVIALAALNLFIGFCAGCAMYYWLGRMDVPGFVQTPPGENFPGMKPKPKA